MMWHVLVTDVADSCYMSAIEHDSCYMLAIEHPHHCLVCDGAKTFLTSKLFTFLTFFLATSPIKLKVGLHICGNY
jgi:hypothetical protein